MHRHQKSNKFGTTLYGLIGVAILTTITHVLTAAQFSNDHNPDTLAKIASVGAVTPTGEGTAVPVVATSVDEGLGVAVYNKACVACHGTGVANAPRFGDKAAWEPRMAQGIGQLLQIVIAGKGAMPPRGTCADCSDDDLRAAIEYMLVGVGYE